MFCCGVGDGVADAAGLGISPAAAALEGFLQAGMLKIAERRAQVMNVLMVLFIVFYFVVLGLLSDHDNS